MKTTIKIRTKCMVLFLILATTHLVSAQMASKSYLFEEHIDQKNTTHELHINDGYLVHTVYEKSPARFIMTRGGFVKVEGNHLIVDLEFNSNYENDQLKTLQIPFEQKEDALVLELKSSATFKPIAPLTQALDGKWLFATRGPDTGQERRGEENPRKTLKLLMNGRFQWIAYHTDSMKFFGTGGGSFSSKNGHYTENIDFFSKDDSRVGATLKFDYELKGSDWHHTGNNSKGEPMYEIWAKR
ncbi:hypothetical protein Q4603_15325 [Zobellia galactanivorans]|uniref:hypothetical protein n=2 Tax=Zobellia galactanivorans (strain DSM 12802 / CCUG 47099 / CIP 106680 / NCIMB 13871 / Dsij) TaxID=63186 RepID=UPI0026E17F7E|nr:hypothetical protein [Zobellia galactanivorans]MDO6809994.1 hypothetical protein [Zobellia galactanivorans]